MKYKKTISLFLIIYLIIGSISCCFASNIVANENQEANYTPEVFAESAILLDIDSNKILFEKNCNKVMYPASTTKLMTAILAIEKCPDLSQKINVSYYAVNSIPATYSTANLVPEEQVSIKDLLYALLIPSANGAAYALAQYIANNGNNYPVDSSEYSKIAFDNSISSFSEMMNSKAKELGCVNTHFVNPNGIHNEEHYSTAYDLMLIGKYSYQNLTLKSICKTTEFTLESTNLYAGEPRTFHTTNSLIRPNNDDYYQYANGLKTGYTDPAQSCIIASANKDDRNLIAVILHSEDSEDENTSRENDCKRLFEYGFNYFSNAILINQNSVVKTINIINGNKETKQLNIICSKELKTFISHGQIIDATPEIVLAKRLAPISKGEVLGTVSYNVNGETLTAELIAEHDVYSINYLIYIFIISFVFLIVLIIFIIFTIKSRKKSKNL